MLCATTPSKLPKISVSSGEDALHLSGASREYPASDRVRRGETLPIMDANYLNLDINAKDTSTYHHLDCSAT